MFNGEPTARSLRPCNRSNAAPQHRHLTICQNGLKTNFLFKFITPKITRTSNIYNNANDLHIESHIANDLDRARVNFIARYPAAMIAVARAEQSKEIARLVLIDGRAIANFIIKFSRRAIKKNRNHDKAANELEAMDDRAMQDIGILRSMIGYAVRGQMAVRKHGVGVTAKVDQACANNVTTSLPVNCNKIDKHHHAA